MYLQTLQDPLTMFLIGAEKIIVRAFRVKEFSVVIKAKLFITKSWSIGVVLVILILCYYDHTQRHLADF